jgi:hypothetical protein
MRVVLPTSEVKPLTETIAGRSIISLIPRGFENGTKEMIEFMISTLKAGSNRRILTVMRRSGMVATKLLSGTDS